MNDSLKNADEALKEQPEVAVLTSGASMRPMLRQHRDVVVITRLNGHVLKRGDVPLYRKDGFEKLVLHRIIKCQADGGYICRGDNNYFTEYDIRPENIVGILKAFYRDGVYFDCQKSFKYKLYSFYILNTYTVRRIWKCRLRPFLGRCKGHLKRLILKK